MSADNVKNADVGIPETPTTLASANVGNGDSGDTPHPLKHDDFLNGFSLTVKVSSRRGAHHLGKKNIMSTFFGA